MISYSLTAVGAVGGWGPLYLFMPKLSWLRGHKTFFMLNAAELEILNTHKYQNKNKRFFRLR